MGVGLALQAQWSNASGGTYINGIEFAPGNNVPAAIGTTVSIVYQSAVHGNYFQLAVSALTSGTFSGWVRLSNSPTTYSKPSTSATQTGTWTVGSNSATGSAVPANAFYMGMQGSTGNLNGWSSGQLLGDGSSGANIGSAANTVYNGTNWDRQRSANGASNTTGTGLLGVGNLGYDGTNYQLMGVTAANSSTTGTSGVSQLVSGTGYTTATITLNSGTPNTNWYDMLNYMGVSVEILTNTTPATLTWQTSGDASETNISGMPLFPSNNTFSPPVLTTTSAVLTYYGSRTGRYFRVSSNNGAGTTTLVITFFTNTTANTTPIPTVVGSNSATGSAVPANGFYEALQARTSSPTAATNGNLVGLTGDVMGEALVATGGLVTTAVAVSASVTVVKAAAGRLCNVLVTTAGTSTAMTIYDNASAASGTIIGVIPTAAIAGSFYTFNMPAANGITCSGSATNPAVTISWI